MIQYLYIITDIHTNKKYVGKTTNYKRRKADHIYRLENHKHKNYKLQEVFNEYGIDGLQWECRFFENITSEELNRKEIELIEEYNSYNNGLNLTRGGDGGNTRTQRIVNFHNFCLAYFGCTKYKGMTNRLALYLGVDSSTISAIVREVSYDDYRQQAQKLSTKEVDEILKEFVLVMNLENKPPRKLKQRMTDEQVFQIICVVSSYTTGIEAAINTKFGISKGLMHRCFTKNNFKKAVKKYSQLSEAEIVEIGKKYFIEWELGFFTPQYRDLFQHYNTNRSDCGV